MHYTTLEFTAGSLKNLFAIMSIDEHQRVQSGVVHERKRRAYDDDHH